MVQGNPMTTTSAAAATSQAVTKTPTSAVTAVKPHHHDSQRDLRLMSQPKSQNAPTH